MKSFLITLSIIVFKISLLNAQMFSVAEFEQLLKLPQDDFETAVMKKQFTFDETDENSYNCDCSTYQYVYGRDLEDIKLTRYVMLYNYNNGNRGVSYQTALLTEYAKLKEQIKLAGYKLSSNKKSEDGKTIYYYYKKGKINLTINATSRTIHGVVPNLYFLHFDNNSE